MNLQNCVYISWKIQILTILQYKITQIFASFWGPELLHLKKNQKKSFKPGHF